jgi:hypothetical protein
MSGWFKIPTRFYFTFWRYQFFIFVAATFLNKAPIKKSILIERIFIFPLFSLGRMGKFDKEN